MLLAFEAAEREDDPAQRGALLTFVVVGGGPTGVELAGRARRDRPATRCRATSAASTRRSARVVLVEASPHLLGAYVPELSAKAARQLERLGVEVRLRRPGDRHRRRAA